MSEKINSAMKNHGEASRDALVIAEQLHEKAKTLLIVAENALKAAEQSAKLVERLKAEIEVLHSEIEELKHD